MWQNRLKKLHFKNSFIFRFFHINKVIVYLWQNAPSDPAGVGYGGVLILIYSCSTYIVILSWALLYLVFSFSSQLPWAACSNYWNSGKTDPAAISRPSDDWKKKCLFQSFVFQGKMTQATGATRPTQPRLPLNSGSMLPSQSSFGVISRSGLVVIIFFLPDDECWLSQGALRRSGVYDGTLCCV